MKKMLMAALPGTVVLAGGLGAGVGAVGATALQSTTGPLHRFFSGQIGRLLTLRSDLNLTDAQRDQIKTILESHRTEIAGVLEPLVKDRRALRDATLADPADEKAIRTAAANLAGAIGDAAVLASHIKVEARKVITPAQMQTLEQFRKQSDASVDRFIDNMGKPL
jgi:Spy/CpxP family protein refolding chaperone